MIWAHWKNGETLYTYKTRSFGSILEGVAVDFIREMRPDFLTELFHFAEHPKRKRGKYLFRSASGHLDYIHDSRGRHLLLYLCFTDVGDAQKLYMDIREGAILPTISFEKEQIAWPPKHLRDVFREVWAILRRKLSHLKYVVENAD